MFNILKIFIPIFVFTFLHINFNFSIDSFMDFTLKLLTTVSICYFFKGWIK